jgi:hypothetical protein
MVEKVMIKRQKTEDDEIFKEIDFEKLSSYTKEKEGSLWSRLDDNIINPNWKEYVASSAISETRQAYNKVFLELGVLHEHYGYYCSDLSIGSIGHTDYYIANEYYLGTLELFLKNIIKVNSQDYCFKKYSKSTHELKGKFWIKFADRIIIKWNMYFAENQKERLKKTLFELGVIRKIRYGEMYPPKRWKICYYLKILGFIYISKKETYVGNYEFLDEHCALDLACEMNKYFPKKRHLHVVKKVK